MQLYLISYEHFFRGEAELVSEWMKGYDFTLHLRKPGAGVDEYRSFLKQIPENLHQNIVLHDAFELSREFMLKGLHFSTVFRNMRNNYMDQYGSTSSHSLGELAELDTKFDQQFLSPVYPSISKPGYKGNLDIDEIKRHLKLPRSGKIIALGGNTANKIKSIHQMGFDGAAVLGSVWGKKPQNDKNLSERFKNMNTCLNRVHIA